MKKILALVMACGLISQNLAYTQSNILTQEQLVEVLADLELAKAMVYTSESSSLAEVDLLFQEQAELIYKAHATDITTFHKSYMHYLDAPIQLQAIYDQLIIKLEQLLKENQ
jgi:hypothetical protein